MTRNSESVGDVRRPETTTAPVTSRSSESASDVQEQRERRRHPGAARAPVTTTKSGDRNKNAKGKCFTDEGKGVSKRGQFCNNGVSQRPGKGFAEVEFF
ncbi:GNAT family N-acetyltransferase [Sesbania bispinosa]|nr:GNAT family N-acetyltransferase [Sesbania bispinosa]